MISAKLTYSLGGTRHTGGTAVDSKESAWNSAERVFRTREDASEITMTEFGNGKWVIRVLSKRELIWKMESA
jgi:hypothetical protein